MTEPVRYPYLPEVGRFRYVPADNPFMRLARSCAKNHSLDKTMPTGAVIVNSGVIIGEGANGSSYHDKYGCERVRQGIPTGQRYELCEGCHPKNHAEAKAVADAINQGKDTTGAELYLWGHWWACEPCWTTVLASGITTICLQEGSEVLFNKNHPDNVVGRQFQ